MNFSLQKILFVLLSIYSNTLFSQDLVIDQSGKVGINESSPTQLLHISDLPANSPGFLIEATGSNFIKAAAGTTASAFFYKDNRFFAIVPAANKNVVGATELNSVAVVGPNANVGIGTWSPSEKLEVIGNVKAQNLMVPSDLRLKQDIEPYKSGLKEILKLSPVTFEYNGEGGTVTGQKHIGLIAQDLVSIAPELVSDGNSRKNDGSAYMQIKDNEVKYLLLNAIKELQKIITTNQEVHETEIKALRKEIDDLKASKQ